MTVKGLQVLSPDEVFASYPMFTPIIVASPIHYKVIRAQLYAKGFTNLLFTHRLFNESWANFVKGVLFEADAESYSQQGEDLIVDSIFRALGVFVPRYAEIGVGHPIISSNTYLFYSRSAGYDVCGGILIEPDPKLEQAIRIARPNDRLITTGVGVIRGNFELFESSSGMCSFSKEFSDTWNEFSLATTAAEVSKTMPVVLFDDILLNESTQYVSLDIEGLDAQVIKSINFSQYPELSVFLCEVAERRAEIRTYMQASGFALFAKTLYNDIYLRETVLTSVLAHCDCRRVYEIMRLIDSGVLKI
jgi:hypothetical protein